MTLTYDLDHIAINFILDILPIDDTYTHQASSQYGLWPLKPKILL